LSPEEIKTIRRGLRLTQQEFASILGVTIHAVRKWEQGQRVPGGAAVTLMKGMKKE